MNKMGKSSNQNEIKQYFHCEKCLKELPPGKSPEEWQQIETGFTDKGVQVWCKRHDTNIIHIDLEGHANGKGKK
ncbi:MAG: hypothetical protein ABIH20_07055 [Candidatus Diapherotrites archaeon]